MKKHLGIILISIIFAGCANTQIDSLKSPKKQNKKNSADYVYDEDNCNKYSLNINKEFTLPEGITEELRQTLILDAINSRYADCMGKKGWEQREF